jgi:CRISPR/Cas system CMR-associated protein Cmr3 (group 5 of RAMP superfamily)
MRTIKRICYASIVIATVFAVNSPVTAVEDSEIIQLYDQYNAQLRQLNLAEPMSLIDKGKIFKANRILKKINTDSLRSFYTKAMNKTDEECYSDSNCRFSDLVSLHVITMTKYDVISIEKINNGSVELVIVGENSSGKEIKLILNWLREDEEWKIDSTMKVPRNWSTPMKKLHTKPSGHE